MRKDGRDDRWANIMVNEMRTHDFLSTNTSNLSLLKELFIIIIIFKTKIKKMQVVILIIVNF